MSSTTNKARIKALREAGASEIHMRISCPPHKHACFFGIDFPERDELIANKIYWIREKKVMLDVDLAELYGVETKRLNEQVRRNITRFPEDFMFQLSSEENENLKSQFATSSLQILLLIVGT